MSAVPPQAAASRSARSSDRAFYSPIEPSKLSGVEPRASRGEAAGRAIHSAGAVTLPRDLK